jgi:hypothetical protein
MKLSSNPHRPQRDTFQVSFFYIILFYNKIINLFSVHLTFLKCCETKKIISIKSRVRSSAIPLDPLMRIVLSISALVAKSTLRMFCKNLKLLFQVYYYKTDQ